MNKTGADQTVRAALYRCLRDPRVYQFPSEHILSGQVLTELNSIIKDSTGVDMSNELGMSDPTASTDIGKYVEAFGRNFAERESRGIVKK